MDSSNPPTSSGLRFAGEDWYGREFAAERFDNCVFVDCDMTEISTAGTIFDHCEFRNVALNASVHDTTRFDNCVFSDSSLFGATLRHCKMTGSQFRNTAMRPLTIEGGVWSWVNLFGADLRNINFDGLNLEETDFGEANLDKATFRGAVLLNATLRGASIEGAVFTRADLSGVQLAGLNWRKARIDGQIATQIAESLGAVVDN